MSTAKYKEDNDNLNEDRMYFKERKGKGPKIYEPEEEFDIPDKPKIVYENRATVDSKETKSFPLDDNIIQNAAESEKNKNSKGNRKPTEYSDKILYCKVCGKEFVFSKNDQIEYDKKGWHTPNRCAKCERRKYLPSWIKI